MQAYIDVYIAILTGISRHMHTYIHIYLELHRFRCKQVADKLLLN